MTDLGPPSTAALARVSDPRAEQFWDKGRLLSRAMGERDRQSVVWDHLGVYAPGTVWDTALPASQYSGRPVVDVIDEARRAIQLAFQVKPVQGGSLR
ncbi:MAG: hypothetical protein L0387_38710 [Acidobacteria bacterium]|nr:hypothetical protein [Acidobacteriota bacterium]MCI0724851.1 hypothetical protein [Acidobacteriota bacterium]